MPPGEPGEILLRGGSVMAHYLDDPEATAAALSADGWLRTGDLGLIDPAGCLRIVGRSKDMYIVGGFNAYPAEIENALLRHPDIRQVAVIGIPDERLGEVGMAFAVLRPGARSPGRTSSAGAATGWPTTRCPGRSRWSTELPVNATGKVVKDVAPGAGRPGPLRGSGVSDRARGGLSSLRPTCGWSSSGCGWRRRPPPPCWPTGAPTSSRSRPDR